MRELKSEEIEAVGGATLGGFIGAVMGSMYHKDAHDGPGGLYGPGGQFQDDFEAFDGYMLANFGVSGMQALAVHANASVDGGSLSPEWMFNEESQNESDPTADTDIETSSIYCDVTGAMNAWGWFIAGTAALNAATDGPLPFAEGTAVLGGAVGGVGGLADWAGGC